MRRKRRVLASIPPFVAGLAAAVALEASSAILLYSTNGLLPALTLILSVEIGALALGLFSGPLPVGGGAVEQVRRRWLFSLVVFALAAALSTGIDLLGELPTTGPGQGLALALLGGLPLFSIGSLLGAMARPDELPSPPVASVGAPAVLGAMAGFLLMGIALLPHVAFYSLFLLCLVVLSGGALLQGWVLDARPAIDTLEVRPSVRGEIRVEERLLGSPRREITVLLEGGRPRGAEDAEGRPARGWEAAVLEAMEGSLVGGDRVLHLGGGNGTLSKWARERIPGIRAEVVEASPELVELASRHFPSWENAEPMDVEYGDPLDLGTRVAGDVALVVLDCTALPLAGGLPALRSEDWRRLSRIVSVEGHLVMGGLYLAGATARLAVEKVLEDGKRWFETGHLYAGSHVPPGGALLPGEERGPDAFAVFGNSRAADWPPIVAGFRQRSVLED